MMNKEKSVCSSPAAEKPLVAQKMDWKALQVIRVFSDSGAYNQKWQNMDDFWDSAVEVAELRESFMDCKEGSINQKYGRIFLNIGTKLDELYEKYETGEFVDLSHMKSHKLFKDLLELARLYVESYKVQKYR